MKAVRMISVSAVAALLSAAPALAQQSELEPFSRAYVSVLGGATLDGKVTPVFAGEYGERVSKHVLGYANVTFFNDLMSPTMRDNLVAASALLNVVHNSSYRFSGRDRGLSVTFGAKVSPVTSGTVRPYVGLGFGTLTLRRSVTEESLGDVTTSFAEEFGVSDGNIDSTATSSTKPMGEATAGVNVVVGRTYVDFNYRFRKAFHTVQSIDVSQFSAGVGVRF